MKTAKPPRSILHVDLDSFFVSVERSLDPALRGRAVVVGGEGPGGVVAAASSEARAAGVRAGASLAEARRLCPEAAFRPGDLEAYARAGDELTAVMLAATRRVERPSIDEAYLDLTCEAGPAAPAQVAERLKDEFQRRLGLDASFGLAGTRLAARVASGLARPRGLLIVLPGYEASFLARQPLQVLDDLPAALARTLASAGLATLGDLAATGDSALEALVGRAAAARLRDRSEGRADSPIAVAAPPSSVQEEAVVRDRASDAAALQGLLDGLARRAVRRLRPFGLAAGALSVEVARGAAVERRAEGLAPGVPDEDALASIAAALAAPLFEPPAGVRRLGLRLQRLYAPSRQQPLFPSPQPPGRTAALL